MPLEMKHLKMVESINGKCQPANASRLTSATVSVYSWSLGLGISERVCS
jgi:hypothetical protein